VYLVRNTEIIDNDVSASFCFLLPSSGEGPAVNVQLKRRMLTDRCDSGRVNMAVGIEYCPLSDNGELLYSYSAHYIDNFVINFLILILGRLLGANP
jgi:hypothetical protein